MIGRQLVSADQHLQFDALAQLGGELQMLICCLRVSILKQMQDYHFVLHWLHEQMPYYVMTALLARVNPDRPEMLWKKYGAKFAEDVQKKRVLYGLQVAA